MRQPARRTLLLKKMSRITVPLARRFWLTLGPCIGLWVGNIAFWQRLRCDTKWLHPKNSVENIKHCLSILTVNVAMTGPHNLGSM